MTILFILFYLISLDMVSRITTILPLGSFCDAVRQPDFSILSSEPIQKPVDFVDKSNAKIFILILPFYLHYIIFSQKNDQELLPIFNKKLGSFWVKIAKNF
jgi:hypothetical protein